MQIHTATMWQSWDTNEAEIPNFKFYPPIIAQNDNLHSLLNYYVKKKNKKKSITFHP